LFLYFSELLSSARAEVAAPLSGLVPLLREWCDAARQQEGAEQREEREEGEAPPDVAEVEFISAALDALPEEASESVQASALYKARRTRPYVCIYVYVHIYIYK